jgi:dipeptidyl aminopeptidase/acylaminoacyl peptidase
MAALRGQTGCDVRAVAALYAPTDLVSLAKNSTYIPSSLRDSVRGTPFEKFLLAGLGMYSPINYISQGMPPFLLIHGTADRLVPFEQSTNMCSRMKAAGATCEVFPVPNVGHGIRYWENSPAVAALYKERLVSWLEVQLHSAPISARF